jgi:hypothetical protein
VEPEIMISKVGLEQITLIVAKELMKFWTSAQSKGIPKQKIVKTSNIPIPSKIMMILD